jgi:hypothetical protein
MRLKKVKMVNKALNMAGMMGGTQEGELRIINEVKALAKTEYVANTRRRYDTGTKTSSGQKSYKGLRFFDRSFSESFNVADFVRQNAKRFKYETWRDEANKATRMIVKLHKVLVKDNSEEQESEKKKPQRGKKKKKVDVGKMLREAGVEEGDLERVELELECAQVIAYQVADSGDALDDAPVMLVTSVSLSPYAFTSIALQREGSDCRRFTLPRELSTAHVFDSERSGGDLTNKAVRVWGGEVTYSWSIPSNNPMNVDLVFLSGLSEGRQEIIQPKRTGFQAALGGEKESEKEKKILTMDERIARLRKEEEGIRCDIKARYRKAADYRKGFGFGGWDWAAGLGR